MHKNEQIPSIFTEVWLHTPTDSLPKLPPNLILAPFAASCLKLDLQREFGTYVAGLKNWFFCRMGRRRWRLPPKSPGVPSYHQIRTSHQSVRRLETQESATEPGQAEVADEKLGRQKQRREDGRERRFGRNQLHVDQQAKETALHSRVGWSIDVLHSAMDVERSRHAT